MKLSSAEKKQIENEMIFRRTNEKVGTDLDELDTMYKKDGDDDLVRNENMSLTYKCECSDENCVERIPMELTMYQDIHTNRKMFIIKPGHQVKNIERVIDKNVDYYVVKKNKIIPEPDNTLNKTTIDNS